MDNQELLNEIVQRDSCGFLNDVSNWCNHRPLLYLALELSKVGGILELGCGDGSTKQLHCYSSLFKRPLISYDYNQEWIDKFSYLSSDLHSFKAIKNENDLTRWMFETTSDNKISVCLVDHSPGERRWEDLRDITNRVDFVVVHDSESAATGYMLDKIWNLYKYRININTTGACAALLSNTIDITQFDNLKLGNFILETKVV